MTALSQSGAESGDAARAEPGGTEPSGAAPFANEPVLELRRPEVRAAALGALARLDKRLPLDVRIATGAAGAVGAAPEATADDGAVTAGTAPADAPVPARAAARPRFPSTDPCQPARVVAHAEAATAQDVDAAVATATAAQRGWGAQEAKHRAEILTRAAQDLRTRRLELAALAVRECGKPWPEADADVCEAIDFLTYYAREAVALDAGRPLEQRPGERNTLRYVARGVVAVIAPWNFPFAIAAGMTAAALATGNAALLKPAEQAPACAAALVQALHDAGAPAGVLALLPGGDEPGIALVAHPAVHAIAFTGSCAAGLAIVEQAAKPRPGQHHVKRVIAEMGGKNCVIVDADADLDDAVPAIVASAFGFAGQKCSAAARVLAHEAIAPALRERLAGAVAELAVGPADDFATDVPAVIDADARDRVARYAALGRATGTVLAEAPAPAARAIGGAAAAEPDASYYTPPLLLADLAPDSPLLHEEIFGPVLTVETVPDIATACARVEAEPFALTGGLFSRSPATVEEVARRTPVGNLYVNREITGAMVGRQPFGGNRLSGCGFKAGGPDYLLQFVEARVVSENTVRHGLVA